MRKSIIIGGAVILVGAVALVIYLNKSDGSHSPAPQKPAPAEIKAKPDNSSKETPPPSPKPKSDTQNPPKPGPQPLTTKDQKLDEFFAHSNVHAQVDLLAEFFRTGLDSLDPQERKVLEPLFEKALQSAAANYRKALAEKFNEQELEDLTAIYRDPEFAAFNEAAIQLVKDHDQSQLAEHFTHFDASKLPQDKREALEEIADAELKIGFSNLENDPELADAGFRQRLKESFLSRLELLTKGKSVEQIRHVASRMHEPLVMEQRRLQEQVFEDSMKAIEDAALEHAIGH